MTQAFCSACPVAYSPFSSELWKPLASLVLEAAYEATFHAALLNRERTESGKVFATLLGGGAFGNQSDWILTAIERSMRIFDRSGLDVRIVSYGSPQSVVRRLVS